MSSLATRHSNTYKLRHSGRFSGNETGALEESECAREIYQVEKAVRLRLGLKVSIGNGSAGVAG